MNKNEGPLLPAKVEQAHAACISYRLQKNCGQTHKINYLEED